MFKRSLAFTVVIFLSIFFINSGLKVINNLKDMSPEISIYSQSPFGKKFGKVVAASCGFSTAGHSTNDYSTCNDAVYTCPGGGTVLGTGTSLCGGACQALPATVAPTVSCFTMYSCEVKCPTGYIAGSTETIYTYTELTIPTSCILEMPQNCGLCTNGITPIVTYTGHQIILNGIYYFTNNTGRPTPQYTLGNCPSGVPAGYNRICEISRTSSDGTNTGTWIENYDTNKTIWSNQLAKTYPYSEKTQIRCGYQAVSSSTPVVQTAWYQADAATLHPNYGLPCTKTDSCNIVTSGTFDVDGVCNAPTATYQSCDKVNICGQNATGFACPNGCNTETALSNNSCITNFEYSTNQVNPNGSVEFTWSIANSTNTPRCSFVDLTTSNPRQIPGLQNLDPTADRARITNIQTSTRFCLVCQFFNSATGALLGEAVKHQWVRVQRIGEN